MRFVYGKQNMRTLERAQENNFLLTNALGGYVSVTGGYGVPRCDRRRGRDEFIFKCKK